MAWVSHLSLTYITYFITPFNLEVLESKENDGEPPFFFFALENLAIMVRDC